jgi:Asp-tRNA(Asn)/Glu-tRNA(Gln) amidotransferase A subunit family amidase
LLYPAPLAPTAAALCNDTLDLSSYIDELCDRIEQMNPLLEALLPEGDRRARLQNDVQALQARYPDPARRPPLYGIPIGVKDTFRVDGFPTQAGSQLPPNLFAGTEAECVTLLRSAGALILGKTVTTEFAYFEPGPTRNPHHLEHTPGDWINYPSSSLLWHFWLQADLWTHPYRWPDSLCGFGRTRWLFCARSCRNSACSVSAM